MRDDTSNVSKRKGGKIRSGNRNVEFKECQYLITTILVENRQHHTNASFVKFESVWMWKTEFFKSLITLIILHYEFKFKMSCSRMH